MSKRGPGLPLAESLAIREQQRSEGAVFFSRESLGRAFIFLVALAVVGVSYWRLYYGVDFTDESFYVAIPYRFILGARPFVDETSVEQQTSAILIYPFMRAYYMLAGLSGIVLFVRHLQFLFSLAVALAVFLSLRRSLAVPRAVLVALAAVAFVPFNIHSLSYNLLGSGLFTAGCLLSFLSLTSRRSRGVRLVAGTCHGLAAFAYPPLLLAVAASVVIRVALARERASREALGYGLPALGLPIVGIGILVGLAGPHQVVSDYRRSAQYFGNAGGLDKLSQVASQEWATLHPWYFLAAALALLAITWRWQRGLAAFVILALPFLALPPHLTFYSASLQYAARYGWLALPLFFAVRRREGASRLLTVVWIPALFAGVTTAYSSANGGANFSIGFFPATVVTSVFLLWSLEQAIQPVLRRVDLRWVTALPAVVVVAILLVFEAVPVYRDSPISGLRARVSQGPYAGLLTSRAKRAFLRRLELDLTGVTSSCRIVFFDDFPAGYLLTSAQPDTNAAWTAAVSPAKTASYQQALLRYYQLRGFPDVVVIMRRIPYAAEQSARIEHYRASEPLLVALRTRSYRLLVSRLNYAIYEHNSSTCSTNFHAHPS